MAGSTFIQIPPDIQNGESLRRFLDKLVLQLDIAFSNRGTSGFTSITSLQEVIQVLNSQGERIVILEDTVVDLQDDIDLINAGESVVSITSDYSVPESTVTVICKASIDITVTLPSVALTSGRSKKIAVTNITSSKVTIVGQGGATVVGEASQYILEGEVLNFISDGTNWELSA